MKVEELLERYQRDETLKVIVTAAGCGVPQIGNRIVGLKGDAIPQPKGVE